MEKDIAKHNLAKRTISQCDRGRRRLSKKEELGVPLYGTLCAIHRIWTTGFGNHGFLGILLRSFETREWERITRQHASIFSLFSVFKCFPRSMSVHHMYAQYL